MRYLRVFFGYLVVLFIWASFLEYGILKLSLASQHLIKLNLNSWLLMVYAHLILYVSAAIFFIIILVKPYKLNIWANARILAYFLAFWATAWIGLDLLFVYNELGNPLPISGVADETFAERFFGYYVLLVYPVLYITYAILVESIFSNAFRDIDPQGVSPRIYRASTIIAGIVGVALLTLGLIGVLSIIEYGEEGLPFLAPMLYPGIGLCLVAFTGKVRRKPYRFLLVFPLFGQSVFVRGLIDGIPLWLLLKEIGIGIGLSYTDILHAIKSIIIITSPIRWLLAVVPGFGGAQAGLALTNFLYYIAYGDVDLADYYPPISLTGLWLFGEWLLFYKSLRIAYHKSEARY